MRLTRRNVLAAGGTLAAASIARPVRAAADQPVRVGFIGVGSRGSIHLKNMLDIPGVSITAICDINPKHLNRAQQAVEGAGGTKPAGTEDWKALLARDDVDAVVSALPCDLHAACYLDTIAAGKDLYGEKPMCIAAADCDRVVEATNKRDRIVQIGFQRRADPRYYEAMPRVHAGELGRLVEGRIYWSNAWGPYGFGEQSWFGRAERSGDWMLEQACHNWDVMNWANRSLPVRASGFGRNDLFVDRDPDRNVHDYYSAVVEYPNGCVVNILHSWVVGNTFDGEYTRLMGDKAGYECNAGVFVYRGEPKKPNEKAYKHEGVINSSLMALESFIDSVRTRKPPIATVEHGRDAVLTCLLVRSAVYRKRMVAMAELQA